MIPLHTGYQPAINQRVKQEAALLYSQDIVRFNPPIRMPDVLNIHVAASLAPSLSPYRLILVNLDGMSSIVQNALLRILEEPPHTAKFFLTTKSVQHILPTILSRCSVFDHIPPSYGQKILDLTESGMDFSSAVRSAKQIGEGLSLDILPSNADAQSAEVLVTAALSRDIILGLKLCNQATIQSLVALRQYLLAHKYINALAVSYEATNPPESALLTFLHLYRSVKHVS